MKKRWGGTAALVVAVTALLGLSLTATSSAGASSGTTRGVTKHVDHRGRPGLCGVLRRLGHRCRGSLRRAEQGRRRLRPQDQVHRLQGRPEQPDG